MATTTTPAAEQPKVKLYWYVIAVTAIFGQNLTIPGLNNHVPNVFFGFWKN
jgi:hypothetical protein